VPPDEFEVRRVHVVGDGVDDALGVGGGHVHQDLHAGVVCERAECSGTFWHDFVHHTICLYAETADWHFSAKLAVPGEHKRFSRQKRVSSVSHLDGLSV
jgi:hypothetical protein